MQHRYSQSEIQPDLSPRPNRDIASRAQHPEYSWEHLTPHRRRQVLALVHHSQGKTRTRRISILVALCLALLVIGAASYFTFFVK